MTTLKEIAQLANVTESEVQDVLDTLGLDVIDCKDPKNLNDVIELLSGSKPVSSLAVSTAGTGAISKKGKASKLAASKKATAKSQLASVQQTQSAEQMSQFTALAQSMGINADNESEMMAELILSYPAIVNAMTARKVAEGKANAEPAFVWGQYSDEHNAQMESVKANFFAQAGL